MFERSLILNIKRLKVYSRQNKRRKIVGEEIFRHKLLELKIHYQRQKVIKYYIVDFFLPKRNLIVEIDGLYHSQTREYDEDRQKFLTNQGYVVLRFTDEQVRNDVKSCIEQILREEETEEKYKDCKTRLKNLHYVKPKLKYKKVKRLETRTLYGFGEVKKNYNFSCQKRYSKVYNYY